MMWPVTSNLQSPALISMLYITRGRDILKRRHWLDLSVFYFQGRPSRRSVFMCQPFLFPMKSRSTATSPDTNPATNTATNTAANKIEAKKEGRRQTFKPPRCQSD